MHMVSGLAKHMFWLFPFLWSWLIWTVVLDEVCKMTTMTSCRSDSYPYHPSDNWKSQEKAFFHFIGMNYESFGFATHCDAFTPQGHRNIYCMDSPPWLESAKCNKHTRCPCVMLYIHVVWCHLHPVLDVNPLGRAFWSYVWMPRSTCQYVMCFSFLVSSVHVHLRTIVKFKQGEHMIRPRPKTVCIHNRGFAANCIIDISLGMHISHLDYEKLKIIYCAWMCKPCAQVRSDLCWDAFWT